MKVTNKLMVLAVSGMLLGSTIFADEKPAAEAPKAAKDDKAAAKPTPEKKPAAKQTKTPRPTRSKDGY